MASYPKHESDCNDRASKPRKRKFHGNQFKVKKSEEEEEDNSSSSSTKKLSTASSDDITINPLHYYRIIEFLSVFGALSNILICRSCRQKVNFQESTNRGLGFKIVVLCTCGRQEIQSGPLVGTGYEINRRIVFVMRLLGIGHDGINVFCELMDMCQVLSNSAYQNIVNHLLSATTTMFAAITKRTVTKERVKNAKDERVETHLKVSGDGSWKKRGFTSLFGVTTLIGYYTEKVIDLIVKSGYCHACAMQKNKLNDDDFSEWYEFHQDICTSNHHGSSGKMEVDSIIEMFSKSDELHGVKYVNYISDGDSKIFLGILNKNPYGEDCPVVKNECVQYVEKRLGTRLRDVRTKEKLGGKNRLTNALITKLAIYYGLAIKRNLNSTCDMRKAIFTTLDHYCSSDESPRHGNCLAGSDSWCEWRQAEAKNQLPSYRHGKRVIDEEVENHIRPIYEALSTEDLLTRCLGGHTQNSNESFNATVWRMNPKHLHFGKKIVEISAFLAAGLFNEGYSSILMVMNLLNIQIGQHSKMFADSIDQRRILKQDKRHSFSSKEARTARRIERMHANQLFEEDEGLLYGPGIAD
ncbi:hypothetical protein ALC62_07834 [Cyphomyrmex costatus]|uniref:Mutator-like transposase domain-containing protein n=1 Tax=Cyphomyrmex costatus TaxID=456900 RepID=A0A151IHD4_9HYME|nr:hypothetical protein ALC62_07834 [Cyphomyrmex costatus]